MSPPPSAPLGRRRRGGVVAFVVVTLVIACAACGETRRPIGDECIRDEDCLSNVCAARTCASAPELVTGAGGEGADAGPRLVDQDASPADAGGRG